MGKIPVKTKSVIYALSTFQQKVKTGFRNNDIWIYSALVLVCPATGIYAYVKMRQV